MFIYIYIYIYITVIIIIIRKALENVDSEKFLYTSEVGRASQYKSAEKTVGTGKLTCTTDCDGRNRSAFGVQRTKREASACNNLRLALTFLS